METHAVKHSYHHNLTNHQQQQHQSPVVSGSSPNPGIAFPLLLSQIESSGSSLNSPLGRTPAVNGLNHHHRPNHSPASLQFSHFLGANKHKQSPASEPDSGSPTTSQIASNGGVKGTPKSKTAATPLATSSGRHQAS